MSHVTLVLLLLLLLKLESGGNDVIRPVGQIQSSAITQLLASGSEVDQKMKTEKSLSNIKLILKNEFCVLVKSGGGEEPLGDSRIK